MRALRRVFLHCVFYRTVLLTMENVSYVPLKDPIVFELEGFEIPPGQGLLLFFLALLNYTVVVLANGVVVGVIIVDRVLHRPMYMMVCNLASCDMMGATAVLIHLMVHFLTGNNSISYNSAIAQAFTVHFYGVSAQTVLSVMAYDRYKTFTGISCGENEFNDTAIIPYGKQYCAKVLVYKFTRLN